MRNAPAVNFHHQPSLPTALAATVHASLETFSATRATPCRRRTVPTKIHRDCRLHKVRNMSRRPVPLDRRILSHDPSRDHASFARHVRIRFSQTDTAIRTAAAPTTSPPVSVPTPQEKRSPSRPRAAHRCAHLEIRGLQTSAPPNLSFAHRKQTAVVPVKTRPHSRTLSPRAHPTETGPPPATAPAPLHNVGTTHSSISPEAFRLHA